MSKWNDEELTDSILAYKEMQKSLAMGMKVIKSKIYNALLEKHGRTTKAYEYRMQNISYVLSLSGREWLAGLRPAKNVGTNVISKIEEILASIEQRGVSSIPFQRDAELNALRYTNGQVPSGKRKPRKRTIQVTTFDRDPTIVAWVLSEANGYCELCNNLAPFLTNNNHHFLEVHHLKHLADGGSDTITNTAALCPNCHREMHYGLDSKLRKDELYSKIERLVKE